jgi:hypothetical protein
MGLRRELLGADCSNAPFQPARTPCGGYASHPRSRLSSGVGTIGYGQPRRAQPGIGAGVMAWPGLDQVEDANCWLGF